ncbi:hypothetical protein ABEF92_001348 [Exophiala dermatitidis]|uniref:Myb-like DNA-binding domain-containing protein n=1 Tax=Exophiala dermatitidis (strain ATCC 34100 / CBS 525.76 / NIH/UT8656) TaxID=858893 RepID=H6C977_EXODN|nr:uncharacterized protein HMPREF1120_08605 [Exophiala dermatitidis NIH/UT8656]EHY60654.1 hypothetical protein HMPREF1120_08605 [Exophiala dermatitidis NIH/UT8656]
MASLRRTKNFASDGQTPIFLYTILKQLDLRSIDWNLVASSLDISNGHAARMRYSRMKSQFEGVSSQQKPAKARKEKDSEGKASKDKGKGKRQLLEEENERLAKQANSTNEPKKARLEPSPYIDNSYTSPATGTGQQFVSPMWNQPLVKLEPTSEYASLATNPSPPPPIIKTEPDASTAGLTTERSTSPAVKQEPETTATSHEMSAVAPVIVKKEPDTTMSSAPFSGLNPYDASATANSYRLSPYANPSMNNLNPSLYMNSYALPLGSNATPSAYSMTQSLPGYAYHPYLYHGANAWPSAVADHNATRAMTPMADNVSLNPLATSYEELLHMPLYFRQAGTGDVQTAESQTHGRASAQISNNASEGIEQGAQSESLPGPGPHDTAVLSTNAKTDARSDSTESSPDDNTANHCDLTSAAALETDSDADGEVDSENAGKTQGIGTEAPAKREPMEVW